MFLCFFLSWWDGIAAEKKGFACQENLSTCNNSSRTVLSLRLLLSLWCFFDDELSSFISENGFGCNVMNSYFSLLNLSFEENYHISIFTTFEKQSMINRLSNPINCNRSAAKILKVMSSNCDTHQKFIIGQADLSRDQVLSLFIDLRPVPNHKLKVFATKALDRSNRFIGEKRML